MDVRQCRRWTPYRARAVAQEVGEMKHKKLRKPSEIRRDASGKFAKRETAAEILTCADSARVGDWTAAGKARREAELLRRRAQWASEASQVSQPVSGRIAAVIEAPAGNACVSCGLEHCDTHADGQEVPEVANAGAWALVWIAAVAGGVAFLLSPLGQSMFGAIGGGK